jgi:hypothetical protein
MATRIARSVRRTAILLAAVGCQSDVASPDVASPGALVKAPSPGFPALFAGSYKLRVGFGFKVPDPWPGLMIRESPCIEVRPERYSVMVLNQTMRLSTGADTTTALATITKNICDGAFSDDTQVESLHVAVRLRLLHRGDTLLVVPDPGGQLRGLPPEFPGNDQDTVALVSQGDTLRTVTRYLVGVPWHAYVRQ